MVKAQESKYWYLSSQESQAILVSRVSTRPPGKKLEPPDLFVYYFPFSVRENFLEDFPTIRVAGADAAIYCNRVVKPTRATRHILSKHARPGDRLSRSFCLEAFATVGLFQEIEQAMPTLQTADRGMMIENMLLPSLPSRTRTQRVGQKSPLPIGPFWSAVIR